MSLNLSLSSVSDKALMKEIKDRFSLEDVFSTLTKDMKKEDVESLIVSLIDNHGFDIDEMISMCLSTIDGQNNPDEVILEGIDNIFDAVFEKNQDKYKDHWDIETNCFPDLDEVRDTIQRHYYIRFLNTYRNDELIDHLENTWDFEDYLSKVRDDAIDDLKDGFEEEYHQAIEVIKNKDHVLEMTPDDAWMWFCNQAGCSYYDSEALDEYISKLGKHLNDSSFKQTVEREAKKD